MRARGLLALFLIAGAAHADLGPGPYSLRLKPQAAPLTYAVHAKRATALIRAQAAPEVSEETSDVTVRATLVAKGEVLHLEVLDGKKLPEPTGDYTPLGEPIDTDGKPAPAPMGLVLPREAVPEGPAVFGQAGIATTTWTVDVAAHADLPRTSTRLQVTGVRTVRGRDCVVIALAATGNERVEGGKRLLEYWGKGEVLFDPKAGVVVEQRIEVRKDDAAWPPPKTGLQRTHSEQMTVMTLVP